MPMGNLRNLRKWMGDDYGKVEMEKKIGQQRNSSEQKQDEFNLSKFYSFGMGLHHLSKVNCPS